MNTKSSALHRIRPDSGFLLIALMIGSFFIAALVLSVSSFVVISYKLSVTEGRSVSTQLAEDAAVSATLANLNASDTWSGTGGDTTLLDKDNIKTTYSATVTTISSTSKQVDITSKVFIPSTASTPAVQRSVQVMLAKSGQSMSGLYAIVSGAGSVFISNATVTGGDMYINGGLTLGSFTTIGSATSPINLYVANATCGQSDGTYPRVCTPAENSNPITIGAFSKIYGKVVATNQTNGANMSNPGLQVGQTAPVMPVPTHDRTAITSAVTSTLTAAAAMSGCGALGGSTTWSAHLKIVGSLTISNGCTVTVGGDVWITGNVMLANGGILKVAPDLTTRPTLMIDGSGGFAGSNSAGLTQNNVGTGFFVVTYYSQASCSPDCSTVTGTDLANSAGIVTISLGNSFNAPGSSFYARWSKVSGANGLAAAGLAGQSVALGNTTLNTSFQGGGFTFPASGWKAQSYKRIYN